MKQAQRYIYMQCEIGTIYQSFSKLG